MTIHLVYTIGDQRTAPYSITNHLAPALNDSFLVKVHDWLSRETIIPESGDLLIGHPAPAMGTIIRNSISDPRWGKRILMSPFAFAIPEMIAFIDPLIKRADQYLAITGDYWMNQLPGSICDHWRFKMTQLDLAVDEADFPFIKKNFNPPGQRRFLYVGRNGLGKGTEYLGRLADCNSEMQFGTIGDPPHSSRIQYYGRRDTASAEARELAVNYDFLLTCGTCDANPTTILEGASWGLIPLCTPQSGYLQSSWLLNLPPSNPAGAREVLLSLQRKTDAELRSMQNAAREPLRTHFAWPRFIADIMEAIHSPIPVAPNDDAWRERARHNSALLARIESRRIQRERLRHALRLPDRMMRQFFRQLFLRRSE